MFAVILIMFAFVLASLAAALGPAYEPWRWRALAMSLACFFLAEVLRAFPTLHLG